MKKTSTKTSDQDIPELRRDQLGKGVRGKYLKQFAHGSNVVVLQPEILKAFPTSESVNKALASMLAFAQETQGLTGRKVPVPRKRISTGIRNSVKSHTVTTSQKPARPTAQTAPAPDRVGL